MLKILGISSKEVIHNLVSTRRLRLDKGNNLVTFPLRRPREDVVNNLMTFDLSVWLRQHQILPYHVCVSFVSMNLQKLSLWKMSHILYQKF